MILLKEINKVKTKNTNMEEDSKKHSCKYCGKQYTRKIAHSRHVILCEIFHKNKEQSQHEIKCEEEENSSIPSTKQLYKIIQELAIKYQTMEQKLNDMQKWVETKKKKINVIHWLNSNKKPNISIDSWINSIQVTEEHIQNLIEHNMTKIMSEIMHKKVSSVMDDTYIHPLFCLTQKENMFYSYNSEEDVWVKFTTEDFIIMLKRIHKKILIALCEWHDKNIERINSSDKMQILYNKTMIKLMGANFTQDSQILSKTRTDLYNKLKTDLKHIIECEFEF